MQSYECEAKRRADSDAAWSAKREADEKALAHAERLSAARDRVIEAARTAVATAYDAAKPEAAVEAAAEELRAAVRALEALEVRDA